MIKKVIQQGLSDFDARSVLPVREHDKMARTLLVAFFNIPILDTHLRGYDGEIENSVGITTNQSRLKKALPTSLCPLFSTSS
jgi:hypothetical protein